MVIINKKLSGINIRENIDKSGVDIENFHLKINK